MSTTTKASRPLKARVPASRSYELWLWESLAAEPQEAAQYLEVAMEDADPRVFLLALKDVTEAYGGVGELDEDKGSS
jgi:DNA-binding phage protein